MNTLLYILALASSGLIVGALARLALPGPDPMSIFQTMLAGVAGSLIAGLITYYAFDNSRGPGFLFAFLCTLGLVYAIRKFRERNEPATNTAPAWSGSSSGRTQIHFMPGCLVGSLVLSLGLTLILNLLIRAF